MSELVVSNGAEYRQSTDAAGLCREIVIATASKIGGKSYVGVEGWQAIAVAHGCAASADCVERVNDEGMSGFKAIGIVRRMSDGAEIARAEGFLGDDEGTWAKRPVYARRAMVQTRAISRACRSAFAHVVVMMKANLSTTPAEEVPHGGFDNVQTINHEPDPPRQPPRKLDGPYTSPTALKAAYQQLDRNIRECETTDELEGLLALDTTVALIDQMKRDANIYVVGGDKLPPEHVPLLPLISQTRAALATQAEGEELVGRYRAG